MSGSELLGGAIGTTLLALGVASIVAWALHRGTPDKTLMFFGAWCGLYGARLIADQPAIVAALRVSERSAEYFQALVTYVINVPVGLFVESLIGPGWRRSIRRAWQMLALYAVVAVAGDLVMRRPEAMMPLNSPILLVAIATTLGNLWYYRRRLSATFRSRTLGAAAVVMFLFVLNENLRRPVAPAINIEPIGVFAFVIALGYVVVARAFRQEADLIAVQRELETARRIQTSLLPRDVPRVGRLELAACYLPMTAVAGDLYDFVPIDASRVGVLVADVSGHGVPAALVASMVKLAFTMQIAHAGDPARVLTAMNRIIAGSVETFVTAVYGVIDSERRVITVANAGHPSVLVGRADGSITETTERGFMLGLAAAASYTNEDVPLNPGDRVLLFTDGLTEAQNRSGDFADAERVAQWLASTDGSSASSVAESVLRGLNHWRGAPGFDDDVTFVVVRVADDAHRIDPTSSFTNLAATRAVRSRTSL